MVRLTDKPRRTCIDCGVMYEPSGVRQQRCASCAAEHTRKKNCEYQRAFRARHRSPEEAERLQRRAWRLDGAKYRAESLVADGLSPSAAAEKLRVSHHTLIRHLSQPEAARRVALLVRDTGEPDQPC